MPQESLTDLQKRNVQIRKEKATEMLLWEFHSIGILLTTGLMPTKESLVSTLDECFDTYKAIMTKKIIASYDRSLPGQLHQ